MADLDGVFRREWGPAVAALARWSGDLTVAEDAVQEACAEAVRAWPRDGVPDNPGAWIVRVARNRALDRIRRESVRPGKEFDAVRDDISRHTDGTPIPHPVRDDELRMMFTCAHPALDPVSQLALTLRLISGLTVAEISRALLQSEAAVAQRITRAKNKIRQAKIPLRVPPTELLADRTEHVLGCVYSVFTEGYWSTAGPSAIRDELCDEAVRLSGELCALMPDARDTHALAALVLLHDSRRDCRVDAAEALVPLDEQDRSAWNRTKIARGLRRARTGRRSARPTTGWSRSPTHRWRERIEPWRSASGTASVPGSRRWTPSRRSAVGANPDRRIDPGRPPPSGRAVGGRRPVVSARSRAQRIGPGAGIPAPPSRRMSGKLRPVRAGHCRIHAVRREIPASGRHTPAEAFAEAGVRHRRLAPARGQTPTETAGSGEDRAVPEKNLPMSTPGRCQSVMLLRGCFSATRSRLLGETASVPGP